MTERLPTARKDPLAKRKKGDFNLALESREGDFSWYRM